ncbi:choice-of-anchor O protein [Hydrogenophaga sp.]|uniref:choice-of-anchor O protein n=1 Tax=Hydrogenophaga sp. TaxID=1904254 RepID=UPI00273556A7|nr:choice-of-anchor O protein [Hydrogenophaga sp.]MDP2988330.1 choice-of-anchor O protein [Hydrogenophaga sp.]
MKVQRSGFWTSPWGKSALGMGCVLPLLTACGGGGGDAAVAPVVPPVIVSPLAVNTPFALSDFGSGDKPKIQRAGDGTLVVAYGDAPDNARLVYDVKAQVERPARDIYVKTCKPDLAAVPAKTCDVLADWSLAKNISLSSAESSINTEWRGTVAPGLQAYAGDIDKPNIKTSGPVMVLTWVSKYCPDGDLATAGVQAPVQRAIRYLERDSRIIPFSCTWMARSTNSGAVWSGPVQLSTGERDAIQDASSGSFNADTKLGQINISWQEDPQGLQLGDGDGPGDGASGANVNGGTDVWYASATVDLSVPATPADDFVLAPAVRLTDNWQGLYGLSGAVNPIFDGLGANVDPGSIEKGQAGAARPNIGMVGSTAIVAYEETKGSEGLDEGKFVRYHAFPFATPPATAAGKAGCVISNPLKNARRVRFLTQSALDAGPGGIQIAVFWKEGIYDKGGPSDIVVRRGMGGLQPANMVPSVDAACATSDYTTAIGLSSLPGENISSRAPSLTVADNGLSDGTEVNFTENALAHRGVLRGGDLWIGYSYTTDLVKLWAQLDNYNFWLRKYTFAAGTGSWDLPRNVTNITDKRINVREPRIFGTPKSTTACPTDPTQCQNTNVIYLAWGTQENVSPFVPDGGADLGIYITASTDGAQTFFAPIRYSVAAGRLFQDDESAYESQVVTRPDGARFYGVWNQADASVEVVPGVTKTVAEYASGSITSIVSP